MRQRTPVPVRRAAGNPLLSDNEIGEQNARGELHRMNFFGNWQMIDLSNPDLRFYRTSSEGYRFFHFGYALSDVWFYVWPPHHVSQLQQLGGSATLLRLTREDALAKPYARLCGVNFFPPKPQFAFSLGEQRLMEHVLLDASDEEAAQEL